MLSDTVELRTAMSTPDRSLFRTAQSVLTLPSCGVIYIAKFFGTAMEAVKDSSSDLLSSGAAKFAPAAYAAELLPEFNKQDFNETFSLYATGATKRDLASGRLVALENDTNSISLSAIQFEMRHGYGHEQVGKILSLKLVGAPRLPHALAEFVRNPAKRAAIFPGLEVR